jgi:hypothetical protein
MKKILLVTDLSDESTELIRFALEAFNDEPCSFYLLHAHSYNINGLNAADLLQNSTEIFHEADFVPLKDMLAQLSQFMSLEGYAKHNFKLICEEGDLENIARNVTNRLEIDILLIGSSVQNEKRGWFSTSTIRSLESVVTTCPIMAVPLNQEVDSLFVRNGSGLIREIN